MPKTQLKISILKTLCYADIFAYPLSFSQLRVFLIHSHRVNSISLNQALRQLLAARKISLCNGYYCLSGREKIFKIRLTREANTAEKLKIAYKVSALLKWLPSVQAVALTGTLAMHNTRKGDDIDLLIITSPGKLWLTRLLVIGMVNFVAKRRKAIDPQNPSLNFRNQICLNLFLDASHLQVPQYKQNLFTAHEVAQAKFIFARNGLDRQFLVANRWLQKHLPNLEIPKPNGSIFRNRSTISVSFPEKIAYRLQLQYMKTKQTNEIISLGQAYFHPGRTTEKILNRYFVRFAQIIKMLKINPQCGK